MKDNLPNSPILASGENGVIKTHKQMLIEAEQKIGEMENERRLGIAHIEELKWLVASARSGVAALATHFGLNPEQVREIYNKYCDEQNAKILEANEKAKAQYIQDLKDGKKPDIQIVDRQAQADNAEK